MPLPALFADTFYWVAALDARDPHHARMMAWGRSAGTPHLVTTDGVMTEVLNWFSGAGRSWRAKATAVVRDARGDSLVNVLPQTRADFNAALALYKAQPDKDYSLTDCRSMVAMRTLGLTEILTNDHHFSQEGFTILFP